ncbi:class I tRNA ligase family protein [Nocardioides immobilis]|uniref:class I tRNA ligase family protein n=1 Tax=Nocardioides immobilis TaxID=2049295 RepID=UPI001FE4BE8E|nr:class I tRNA ligase family protein [Nocardioides immobilis]
MREAAETVTVLLSLVAPSTVGEIWEQLGQQSSVTQASWPEVDPALLERDAVTAVV